MSSAGVPAEPWVAAEFRAVNGEIVNESDEAEEHKAYAMEAARRFGPADAGLDSRRVRRGAGGGGGVPWTLIAASRCAQAHSGRQLRLLLMSPLRRVDLYQG